MTEDLFMETLAAYGKDVSVVVDLMLNYEDVFAHGYIGHWACGVKHYPGDGWLIFDEAGSGLDTYDVDAIIEKYEQGSEQEHVHFIDKKFAIRAALQIQYLDDWDAADLDFAVQTALFGDVQYS